MRIRIVKCVVRTSACRMMRHTVGLALLVSSFVDAHPSMQFDSTDIVKRFRSVDVLWDDVEAMSVGGVVMRMAGFRSSNAADVVAQKFTQATTVFDRVLTMPGHLVLSGVKESWHWLALISVSSTGSYGYVSTLQSRSVSPIGSLPWMSQHFPALYATRGAKDRQILTQYAHRFPFSHAALRKNVEQQLLQQGWKRQAGIDAVGSPWEWHQSGQQLSIVTVPDKEGTVMFTHHIYRGKRQ